ncbi:hypothetical protein E4U41_000588 [Claviceps citrina]|nr:hypothetical protein E4U41_000588 [Claviceps citrina]
MFRSSRFTTFFTYFSAASVTCFVLGLAVRQIAILSAQAQHMSCTRPAVRREWRALKSTEQLDFVQAIKCMSRIPSFRDPSITIHILFVIESLLKERCGYQGLLPYWDWSLDWIDLASSSIWNGTTGFGGDGDADGAETVGEGRCVTTGPFADLRPVMYNHTRIRHCLSRGFRDGNATGHLPGAKFRPENIGEILRQENYTAFVRKVERDLHNTLHTSINGDFKAMTAANDPLFFLHHVTLDRLWWKWQREDPTGRLLQYSGKHMYNSSGAASPSDMLLYDGFADNVPVQEAMNTEGGKLCYTY